MNGPEHYAEAERLVQLALDHYEKGDAARMFLAPLTMQQAQVHATLALAAAQAEQTQSSMFTPSARWVQTLASEGDGG